MKKQQNKIEPLKYTQSLILGFFVIACIFFITQEDKCVQAQAVFSPNSQTEVINLIHEAKETIDVQMYILTSEQIALELADACKRKVQVRVIIEKRTEAYNLAKIVSALEDSGVEVRWASEDYKLTHTKMMIIDSKKVFIGSTNFSSSALLQNREASVILEGKIVQEFIRMFENDWDISTLV